MLICHKIHMSDRNSFCLSLLSKDCVLSTVVCGTYNEPGSTVVEIFALWLSSNSNKWDWIIDLLDLDTFKRYSISLGIQVVDYGSTAGMFMLMPVKVSIFILTIILLAYSLVEMLIVRDCSMAYVTLAPKVVDNESHVIAREVIDSNRIEWLSGCSVLL